jgi:anaerobic magnesium-protoporphyrin IX monomethyl ester cyclase
VCLGEGEFALMEIIKRRTLTSIPGIAVRHHRYGITQEPPVFIDDLDTLPFPAVELLPMRQYLHHFLQFDTIAPSVKGMAILSSRGCPFSCAYCQPVLKKLFGERIRRRSPGNVVDEMELRQKQLGVSGFMFADDTFGTQRLWVEKFCEEIRKRQLNVIWGCDLRADRVDPQLLQTMWNAGLRKIAIGIEVYDDAYRADVLNKPISREQVESAVTAARRFPISVQGYFMIGGPGETRSSIRRTIQYANRLPIDDATFSITTPLPGTLLEAKFRDRITLSPEKLDYYRHYAFETTSELEPRWLKRMLVWAYASFYGQPWRLAKQARLLATRGGISRFWTKLRRVIS